MLSLYMPESIPDSRTLFSLVNVSQPLHVSAMGPLAVGPISLGITPGVSRTFIARPSDECHEKWQCRGLNRCQHCSLGQDVHN